MSPADAFCPQGRPTWWPECARPLLIFAYGLALVRITGRRVFGKWSALDIVASNLSRALTGSAPLFGTLAATTLLMALHWVLDQGAARSRWLSGLVERHPIDLARDGEARSGAMRRDSISRPDLEEALHQSGVEQVATMRPVVLEPSGKITVLKPEQLG